MLLVWSLHLDNNPIEHFSEETREELNINLESLIQHQFCQTLNSKTMF